MRYIPIIAPIRRGKLPDIAAILPAPGPQTVSFGELFGETHAANYPQTFHLSFKDWSAFNRSRSDSR
jgi:hypothetical protein